MVAAFLKKYRKMILCSIFFFYLGCGITLKFMDMECVVAKTQAKLIAFNTEINDHSNVEYAVVIPSAAKNGAKRDVIRSTWMRLTSNIVFQEDKIIYRWNQPSTNKNNPHNFIRLYFVIGTLFTDSEVLSELNAEHNKNKDLLILEDIDDKYDDLPFKVLKSMEWFAVNLSKLKYLIKCDDDSFVRVDLIIRDLDAYAPRMKHPNIAPYVSLKWDLPDAKGLYWGYFNGRAQVQLTGKWKEEDWFLSDHYLPYALGGGYVVSKFIVTYLGLNNDILSAYNSEDVSMGVWTSSLREINRVHDTRFDTEWKSRGCSHDMLIRHKQTPDDMIQMYKNLLNSKGKKLCTNVTMVRKSYKYNWFVLPSLCCK